MSQQLIERDYNGQKPDGIQIDSNRHWLGMTVGGILVLHWLLPPIFAALAVLWTFFGFICLAPGLIVLIAAHHTVPLSIVAVVLMLIGTYFWIKYSWQAVKRIFRWFDRRTHYRWGPGYNGPLGGSHR